MGGAQHGDRCDNLVHLRSDLTYAVKSFIYRVYQAFNRGIKLVRGVAGLPYWSLAQAVNTKARARGGGGGALRPSAAAARGQHPLRRRRRRSLRGR